MQFGKFKDTFRLRNIVQASRVYITEIAGLHYRDNRTKQNEKTQELRVFFLKT